MWIYCKLNKAEEDVWFATICVEAKSTHAYAQAVPCSSRTHNRAFFYILSYSTGGRIRWYKPCRKLLGKNHQYYIHKYSSTRQFNFEEFILQIAAHVQDEEYTRLSTAALIMTAREWKCSTAIQWNIM